MTGARSSPVLLCWDGSAGARHALEEAAAAFGGGPALVLSVWEALDSVAVPALGLAGMVDAGLQKLNEESAGAAEDLAAKGVVEAREAGFDAQPLPLRADRRVWRAILEAARVHDARAIVIGSRGLSGVTAMLGSVAYRVAHHADRPVFLVPPAEGHR